MFQDKDTHKMNTGKGNKKSRRENPNTIAKPKPQIIYKPQGRLEKWLVAIACATFFPLVYLIGRAVIYLFG